MITICIVECLINEDCADTDYCDPNTKKCTDACNLDGKSFQIHKIAIIRAIVKISIYAIVGEFYIL